MFFKKQGTLKRSKPAQAVRTILSSLETYLNEFQSNFNLETCDTKILMTFAY